MKINKELSSDREEDGFKGKDLNINKKIHKINVD